MMKFNCATWPYSTRLIDLSEIKESMGKSTCEHVRTGRLSRLRVVLFYNSSLTKDSTEGSITFEIFTTSCSENIYFFISSWVIMKTKYILWIRFQTILIHQPGFFIDRKLAWGVKPPWISHKEETVSIVYPHLPILEKLNQLLCPFSENFPGAVVR